MRVIFVHGAFVRDGAWWWAPVAERLDGPRVRSQAAALPSCGEAGAPPDGTGPGLVEDAAALTRLIAEDDDDVVLVASSYGGTVVAQATMRPNVRHLVYLSSFLPRVGETHADVVGSPADPVPVVGTADGSLRVIDDDPAAFDRRFLHDVADPALVRGAHERLTAQSPAAFGTATTAAAWQDVPSTYLVCAEDANTDPAVQRVHAARATRAVDLPTGHHPFLSRPDLVADELRLAAWG